MIVLRSILGQEKSLCTELGQEGAELDASLSALLLSAIFFETSFFGGFSILSLCACSWPRQRQDWPSGGPYGGPAFHDMAGKVSARQECS